MKFAKQLRAERHQEWAQAYVDYKFLKQILKTLEAPTASIIFCKHLEEQVDKVAAFLSTQQDAIASDVRPLIRQSDHPATSMVEPWVSSLDSPANLARLSATCEGLVRSIELLQSYTALNHEAMRKIIKKFDKRFGLTLHTEIPVLPAIPYTAKDLKAWLMAPASRCVKFLRELNKGVGRPVQFDFWVMELAMGCDMLRSRHEAERAMPLDAGDTQHRLLWLYGGSDCQLSVKNTFINGTELEDTRRSRPNSLPPDFSRSRRGRAGIANAAETEESEEACELQIKLKEEEAWETSTEDGFGLDNNRAEMPRSETCMTSCSSITLVTERVSTGSTLRPGSHSSRSSESERAAEMPIVDNWHGKEQWQGYSPDANHSSGTMQRSSPMHRGSAHASPKAGAKPGSPSSLATQDRSGAIQKASSARPGMQRWWTESVGECPLSGFPVNLLPYPPFKFRLESQSSSKHKLVDGLFLVLHVLSTWQFEALGRPLSSGDSNALDTYVKRCKLGPWRLGEALEWFFEGTPETRSKLEDLRGKARHKLQSLQHIQQKRKQTVRTP